jgi:hypothetical protein
MIELLETGFGLLTQFIEQLNTVRDYILVFTVTYTQVPTVTSLVPLLGSSFQRQAFPYLWVPELSLAPSISL